MNGDGEIVVRVEQADAGRDNAVPVRVRVVAPRDVVLIFEFDQIGHGVGRGAVHTDFAVVVNGHEAKRGVNGLVHDRDVQAVAFGNGFPIRHARAAKWVRAQLQAGRFDRFHVYHAAQIVDIGQDVIVLARGGSA